MMAISNIGLNAIILASIVYALDVLAVALRVYCRHLKKRALGLDDYCAIIALIACSGDMVAATIAIVEGGMGFHLTELTNPPKQLAILGKCLMPLQIFWSMSNTFVKLSICFLYVIHACLPPYVLTGS